MSYAAQETSRYSGQPVEGYLFTGPGGPWRFTSAERDQTILAATYLHDYISSTALGFSREERGFTIEVRVKRTNPVAALFIAYTPISPVGLTIYRKHRSDAETISVFIGNVTGARFEGPDAILTCVPISTLLGKRLSIVHSPNCNWSTYGIGCGLNPLDFRTTGIVLTVVGPVVTATAYGGQPDGYFRNGYAEIASGDKRMIVEHVGTAITLISRFPVLNPTDTLYAFAGDDQTEEVCRVKFNNLKNFSGFSRVPRRNPFSQHFV